LAIHLYCLLPAASSARPPAAPAVRVLQADGFVAWVSDTADARLSRDARDAARATIEHDGVIGAAIAQGVTPVPAALADPYDTDDELLTDIASHAPAIREAILQLTDLVEMTAIVAMTDAALPEGAEGRGRAYLEQLRSQSSRAAAVLDRIAADLRSHSGQESRRVEGGRAAISHLVRRELMDAYRQSALTHVGQGYRIVIDGPRAPYSFGLFSPQRGMVNWRPVPAA
jgi:hypothetical protein